MENKLTIKDEFIDVYMSSPLSGRDTHLKFLEKALYPYWYTTHPWLFNVETEISLDEFMDDNITIEGPQENIDDDGNSI